MRLATTVLLGVLLAGCSDDSIPAALLEVPTYAATIRRTSHGIPHITADDLGSVAFGLGYAGAQDFVCSIADQLVKVRGQRARTFGAGDDDGNVNSDFAYLALHLRRDAEASLAQQSSDMRAMVEGYAAGYNRWLEVAGPGGLPAPCTGADWVTPITAADLTAYYMDLNLRGSAVPFLGLIAAAEPPSGTPASSSSHAIDFPDFRHSDGGPGLGSNGWGLGRERSASGGGMLVANPHFPWEGELRFHESHLTVPGQLDVYGASLLGVPVINIGFNKDVAWTHTVTPAHHFTVYKLTLQPGDPTKYLVDGQVRAMTSEEHTIEVKGDDGALTTLSRTLYRSHHGPIVATPGLDWTAKNAYTYRDANETNLRFGEQWLHLDRATSTEDLRAALAEVHGIPWVYTVAADKDGDALLVDASRVPNLSPETVEAYRQALATDGLTQIVADNGIVLLDGSTSRDEWVEGTELGAPGLVPVAGAPALARADFVVNANDPAWLTNPAAPLTDYPLLYGESRTPVSPRTRMNLITLTEMGEGAASGPDGLFTLDELAAAVLGGRGLIAEQLRDAVVARCQGVTEIQVDAQIVPLGEACGALAAWDGRLDVHSVGALVWRELLGQFAFASVLDAGALFAVPFDPDHPLTTPNTLIAPPADGPDPILVALGAAVVRLGEAGFSPATPLGEAQFTRRGDLTIPVPGGVSIEGTTNIAAYSTNNSTLLPRLERGEVLTSRTGLTAEGYPINFGTSFVMAMEFAPDGPRAQALLTYSQSTDPSSPYFADQTARYSEKAWRPILFTEAEIAADPSLVTETVSAPR
jgi:acyl-homoserine-lactone acylase